MVIMKRTAVREVKDTATCQNLRRPNTFYFRVSSILGILFILTNMIFFRDYWNDHIVHATVRPLKKVGVPKSHSNIQSQTVCNKTESLEMTHLCSNALFKTFNTILEDEMGGDVHVIQIGAHVGFEINDPLANGMLEYLDKLSRDQRKRFHWVFVEPSPPNYAALVKNIANYSHVCDMSAINTGVVSDLTVDTESLTFFSFNETIDPITGFDSRSGKKLPHWITQVSSFSMEPLAFNKGVFRRIGLDFEDYIVKSNINARRYSELICDIMEGKKKRPELVLIDTEGFDCDIVLGMSANSSYLPKYLLYENKQCRGKNGPAMKHLNSMDYTVVEDSNMKENTVAFHLSS